jgi:hypothetical protein
MPSGGAAVSVVLLCVGFGVGVWYYRDHPENLAAFVTAFFHTFHDQDRSRTIPSETNGSDGSDLPHETSATSEEDNSTVFSNAQTRSATGTIGYSSESIMRPMGSAAPSVASATDITTPATEVAPGAFQVQDVASSLSNRPATGSMAIEFGTDALQDVKNDEATYSTTECDSTRRSGSCLAVFRQRMRQGCFPINRNANAWLGW